MNTKKNESLSLWLAGGLTAAIFVLDVLTPADVSAWLLYLIPLLLTAKAGEIRGIWLLGLICAVLTGADFFLSLRVAVPEFALVNHLLGVAVLWVAAWLLISSSRSRAALAASEERNRTLVQHSPDCVHEIDHEGRLTSMNPAGLRMLGVQDERTIRGMSYLDTVAADDKKRVSTLLAGALRGEPAQFEFQAANGLYYWSHLVPITDAEGRVLRLMGVTEDITARKQAEVQLRLQAMLLDQIGDTVTATDLDGRIIYVNDAQCRALKRSREELLGASVETFGDDPARGATQRQIIETTRAQGSWRGEVVNRDREGREIVVDCWTTLIKNEAGEPVGMCGAGTDITERKRAEENLKASEHRYQELIDNQSEGVGFVDAEERFVFSNPAGDEIFGLLPGNLVGRTLKEFTTPAQYARVLEQTKLRRGGARSTYELEIVRADGQRRWLQVTAVPRTDEASRFAGTFGIFRDITEHRRVEVALRESEERFRKVFEEGTLGMVMASIGDGRFLRANAVFCQMLGYTEEELKRLTFVEVTHREHRGADVEAVERLWQGQIRQYKTQKRYHKKNGETLWGALTVSLIRSEDGKPLYSLGMIEDITERRQAEVALRQSEERYRNLFVTMSQGVVYQSADGHITSANPAAERILGLTLSQMQERTSVDPRWQTLREDGSHFPGSEHPAMRALVTRQRVRGIVMGVFHPAENQHRWILVDAVPEFRPGEDQPWQVYTTFSDITELKRAEESLRQLSGRLLQLQDEERRRIARELHDATAQEMAALSLSLSLLSAHLLQLEPKPRELLDRSIALADQCVTGVRTLSYLLHPPLLDELGLAGAVRDFVGGFTQRSGIAVELELSSRLKRLPGEIELALFRVLQESLLNVHRHSGSKTASIRLSQSAGEFRLEVQDTGRGISARAGVSAERGPTNALGVGISGMRERMRQLGGRLEIDSAADGTIVRAIVPLPGGAA